jgi:hypothetical protein
LRDDVQTAVAELTQLYKGKLEYLNRLLLNESDKLHYIKSGNLEKIFEIIEDDRTIIDNIDVADYHISGGDDALSKILGTDRNGIYSRLGSEENETREILSLRSEIRKTLEIIHSKRDVLLKKMTAESLQLKMRINELSRIDSLKFHDSV